MLNRAQRRAQNRLREQLRKQIEAERNGAPIPPDILAKMTKPKEPDALWQVMITERDSGNLVPMGPMMCADACGMMVEAVNKQITMGQRRDWKKAEAYPMTAISNGVN